MIDIKPPWIIKDFFPKNKYELIMKDINSLDRNNWRYEKGHNRYIYNGSYFDKLSLLYLDKAREAFNSKTLLYTYSIIALYNKESSNLRKHKDNNACTYTFDVCLYSKEPWPLVVEDKEYVLNNNEALCFYGEDQWHWRPEFKKDNKVLMLFMHWAEPDHMFFQDVKIGE